MTVDKIKEIKCFILDMDGTIYLGNQLFDFTKEDVYKRQIWKHSMKHFQNIKLWEQLSMYFQQSQLKKMSHY